MDSVECPGCGAKVLNVHAEPGAAVRCMNCGKRFAPVSAMGDTAPILQPLNAEPITAPTIREPQSAGYWFLRIPSMLYGFGATLAFGIFETMLFYSFFVETYRGSNRLLEFFMGLAYLPLLPLSAYYFFAATRALARTEKHMLKAAWNEKLICSALPAATGSSLPYILPLAVGPVVIFIVSAAYYFGEIGYADKDGLMFSGIASVASFVLAFMVDDLRQFMSRQRSMADACARRTDSEARPSEATAASLAVLPALTLIALALMFTAIFNEVNSPREYRGNSQQFKMQVLVILTLVSCTLTVFLTGRNFHRAVMAWWRAAAQALGSEPQAESERTARDPAASRVFLALAIFSVVGAFTAMNEALRNRSNGETSLGILVMCGVAILACTLVVKGWLAAPRSATFRSAVIFIVCAAGEISILLGGMESQSRRDPNSIANELLAVHAGVLFCATLSKIYSEVRSWRRAQVLFWMSRGTVASRPILASLPRWVVGVTVVLVAIQSALMTRFIWNDIFRPWSSSYRWFDALKLPLVIFLVHFPIIWIMLMAREILLAEETVLQARERTEQRAAQSLVENYS